MGWFEIFFRCIHYPGRNTAAALLAKSILIKIAFALLYPEKYGWRENLPALNLLPVGEMIFNRALGRRLKVGHQVLALAVGVRVPAPQQKYAPVAQLDRASGYGPEG